MSSPRHIEVQVIGRPPRQRGPPLRPGVLDPAPAPEGGRGGPGVAGAGRVRRSCGRPRSTPPAPSAYEGVGTVEFVGGRRRLRVPRDEHPPAGGARGDRAGYRRRPGRSSSSSVAAGAPLPFTQDEVRGRRATPSRSGCAPSGPATATGPTPGPVRPRRAGPQADGLRVDAAVETGSVVSVDLRQPDGQGAWPWAPSGAGRRSARLRAALGGPLELDGLETNRDHAGRRARRGRLPRRADGHRLPRTPPRRGGRHARRRGARPPRRRRLALLRATRAAPRCSAGRPPELALRGPGRASGPPRRGRRPLRRQRRPRARCGWRRRWRVPTELAERSTRAGGRASDVATVWSTSTVGGRPRPPSGAVPRPRGWPSARPRDSPPCVLGEATTRSSSGGRGGGVPGPAARLGRPGAWWRWATPSRTAPVWWCSRP